MIPEADEKAFTTMTKTAMGQLIAELRRTGAAGPVFLVRQRDGQIRKLQTPASMAKLMNYGEAKDGIFAALRKTVQLTGATAVCMGNEAWRGKQTEAGRLAGKVAFIAATRQRGFQEALDKGWITREECLVITLQTETMVRTVCQPFERDEEARAIFLMGDPEINDGPQSLFAGRQKMYGDCREENLF